MKEIIDILDNITAENIENISTKAYYISLRIIDVYSIYCILANNTLNSIVYIGLLHSAFITRYLITNFNYSLEYLANPISNNCIQIDDESIENICVKIKNLISRSSIL